MRPGNCCYSSASNNRICATVHPISSSRESTQNFYNFHYTVQGGLSPINQDKMSFYTDWSSSLRNDPGKGDPMLCAGSPMGLISPNPHGRCGTDIYTRSRIKSITNENLLYSSGNSSQRSVLCLVTQWCLILCDRRDCSPPGSSVHGILQARILEWVAMPSSRSSPPKDWTQVSCIAGGFFTVWATRESHSMLYGDLNRKEIQKRGDICICMADWLPVQWNTTL